MPLSGVPQHYNVQRLQPTVKAYDPINHLSLGCPRNQTEFCKRLQDGDTYFNKLRWYQKQPSKASIFETPYYSPSYLAIPVNYDARSPDPVNYRRKRDNINRWHEALSFHDRAFGTWQREFGQKYFYNCPDVGDVSKMKNN